MLIRPADVPKKATDLLEQLQGLPTRIGRSVYFLLIEDEAREERSTWRAVRKRGDERSSPLRMYTQSEPGFCSLLTGAAPTLSSDGVRQGETRELRDGGADGHRLRRAGRGAFGAPIRRPHRQRARLRSKRAGLRGIAAPAGTPPRVVDELGRAFVAASSSRAFGKVLLGTGRKPRQLRPGDFADYVEKQSRSLSRAAPETAEGEWKLSDG
jgi:hypothetical protein